MYFLVTKGSPCRATPYPFQVCRSTCLVMCKHAHLKGTGVRICSDKNRKMCCNLLFSKEKNTTTLAHLLNKWACASRRVRGGLSEHLLESAQTSTESAAAATSVVVSGHLYTRAVLPCCERRLTWRDRMEHRSSSGPPCNMATLMNSLKSFSLPLLPWETYFDVFIILLIH